MSAINISVGLLIVLLAILVLHRTRKLPQIAGTDHKGCAPLAG